MFYTILFLLTCCELIRRVRSLRGPQKSVFDFWGRGATTKRARLLCFWQKRASAVVCDEVLAICFLPSMLFR